MELTSPKTIKELLLKHGSKPNKILGQNFLIDKNVLNKIILAADIKRSDMILEVGPGIGTLTKELAQNAGKVIAIEKDKKMLSILKETLAEYKNIEIINADILSYKLQVTSYKVVANIPYYLTSPLIRKFLEAKNRPEQMVLMIQKEVAQRICASPAVVSAEEGKTQTRRRQGYGGRGMSLLAVSVQFYAEPKIISYISKNCFMPSPKVDSAIIKITPQEKNNINAELFFRIAKAGFSQPRKQLSGNLAKNLELSKKDVETWLVKNNIKPSQRAETLSISDWQNLTNSFWL